MNLFKNNHQVQPDQEPMEPTTPAPTPEVTPKRRRFNQPTFATRLHVRAGRSARFVVTSALAVLMFGANAQTDNTKTTNSKDQGQQTDPQNTNTQQGWVMWNDQMGRDLNIPADQMQHLREVDERYAAEYRALGTDPTKNPGYRALTERRTNDIRGIISGDTYTRWEKRYGGAMGNDHTNRTAPGGTIPKGNTTNPEKRNNSGSETTPPKKTTP
jgi:hypothetical protein